MSIAVERDNQGELQVVWTPEANPTRPVLIPLSTVEAEQLALDLMAMLKGDQ